MSEKNIYDEEMMEIARRARNRACVKPWLERKITSWRGYNTRVFVRPGVIVKVRVNDSISEIEPDEMLEFIKWYVGLYGGEVVMPVPPILPGKNTTEGQS